MNPNVRRLPFVLLGLMTVASFGGPLAFGLILRGGKSPDWPPDRAVEWWTLAGLSAAVVALMIASIGVAVANQRALARVRAGGRDSGAGGPGGGD